MTQQNLASSYTPVPNARDVLDVAWPLALKSIMLFAIVVIDAYLVSFLGEEAVAAIGVAGAITGLMMGVIVASTNATQIRIAQSFGGSGPVGLKTAYYCGLTVNLVAVAVGLVLLFIFGDAVVASFAQTEWIAAEAQAYLAIFMLVILVEAVGQCAGAYFNGCGQTRIPFYSYFIALPLNTFVSLVLIHGLWGAPEMGVAGAAVGSVVGSLARHLFMGLLFWRATQAFTQVKGWRNDYFSTSLRRHVAFSWPIAGTFITSMFGTQICMLIYAKMSVNDFAALTLMMPWVQTAGTMGMAWAQATGIVVAQLLGAHRSIADLDLFLSRAWRASFLTSGLVAAAYFGVVASSGWMYSELQDETRAALWIFLPILLLLPFPKGSNAICGNTLRASGDTVAVMNIFIVGQWAFKVPLTFVAVVFWDWPVGWVFAIVLMEELVKFPLFHTRLYKGVWKTNPRVDI